MTFHSRAFLAALLCLVVQKGALGAENWPGFRGPTGLGYTDEKNLPIHWGGADNLHVAWKSPLRGQGHASPIVWGNRVFVCTAYWPPVVTDRAHVIPEHHVQCFAVKDGKLLWDVQVPPGTWMRSDFRSGQGGGYASPTPTTDGKLVYCVFGSAVIAALDFNGKIAWRKELLPHSFDVTVGSSPVLFKDTVLQLCAMNKPDESKVIAFDKATGNVKWVHKLGVNFAHSTPVTIDVKGKPQLLVLASGMGEQPNGLQAFDPEDCHLIWWCRGGGDASSPAYGDGLVYFDSGRGGKGTCVDPAGTGDLSKTNIRWTIPYVAEGIGSPVIVGKYLYRLHSPGVLRCFEMATGKQVYSHRLEGISTTWASPVVDPEGRLFFANGGKSFVIQPGPEFKELATNDLHDPNHASAAAAQGKLFILGSDHLFCIERKPSK